MRQRTPALSLAAIILLAWLGSLITLMCIGPCQLHWWGLILAVLIRSQLQTGLFIVAHDAMHGVLWPGQRGLNDACGALALGLYAALPYQRCRRNHHRHHDATATSGDPDFVRDQRFGMFGWYRQFMASYLSWQQMSLLLCTWGCLGWWAQALTSSAWSTVLLFCTLPLLISSLQLFIVGTYLPHRVQRQPHHAPQPSSLNLPPWLSFLACFHFGYHREHHDHPHLSWFQLPGVRCHQTLLTVGPAVR